MNAETCEKLAQLGWSEKQICRAEQLAEKKGCSVKQVILEAFRLYDAREQGFVTCVQERSRYSLGQE